MPNGPFGPLKGAVRAVERGCSADLFGLCGILVWPIWACDCSPFARLKSPNYKTGRFFQWSGVDLPLWLELFGRCVFVDIIRNDATFCGAPFPLFHIGV